VPRILLAVHAHPDDESSKGAGTLARYADEGARTVIVTCTGGEAGEILNPAMNKPGVLERMPEVRREELAKALEILKVSAHYFLGYRDSGMPGSETNAHPDAFVNAPLDEAVGRLVRIIREERPQVLLTYNENGDYPHPDHVRSHEISVAAFEAAGDPGRYPEAGPAWQPLKLYYHASWSLRRLETIHAGALARGIESPYGKWLKEWEKQREQGTAPAHWREPRITTQVDVGAWLERRRAALIAHATQIDPEGEWFAVPEQVLAEVYPWEDFTLVRSLVPTRVLDAGAGSDVALEHDLFEGIDADGNPL
jgi:mycothiol S-conjugate amidase